MKLTYPDREPISVKEIEALAGLGEYQIAGDVDEGNWCQCPPEIALPFLKWDDDWKVCQFIHESTEAMTESEWREFLEKEAKAVGACLYYALVFSEGHRCCQLLKMEDV